MLQIAVVIRIYSHLILCILYLPTSIFAAVCSGLQRIVAVDLFVDIDLCGSTNLFVDIELYSGADLISVNCCSADLISVNCCSADLISVNDLCSGIDLNALMVAV